MQLNEQHTQYQQLSLIGEGGMGKVYRAFDTRLRRAVVIKFIKEAFAHHDKKHVLKEAQALAKVNHPNVMQVFTVVEDGDVLGIVGEYIEGENLANFQRQRVMSLEQKLEILRQICDGMQAVHNADLIHGDLKAANVLITESGQAKVIDFGIAQHLEKPKDNNQFFSISALTPEFLSSLAGNEETSHRHVNSKSDLFTYGVLAYELIAGTFPFGKGSVDEVSDRIRNGKFNDPDLIHPPVPKGITRLLKQLLETNPDNRPHSFKGVAEQLQLVLKGMAQDTLQEQMTQEVTEPDITKSKLIFGFPKRTIMVAASVIALIALLMAGNYYINSQPNTYQYVAVLKPEFTRSDELIPEQKEVIQAAFDYALSQAIIDHPQLQLIPRQEVTVDNIEEIAKRTSANYVLTTQLTCEQTHCEVTLNKYSDNNWVKAETVLRPTQADSTSSALLEMQSGLNSLFPELNSSFISLGKTVENVREEDFQAFLKLYNDIQFNGHESKKVLSQLLSIINRSPHLYSVYPLFRQVALNLYKSSNEELYIKQLRLGLDNAPNVYKDSLQYIIDQLWIALYTQDMNRANKLLLQAKTKGADRIRLNELQASFFLSNDQSEKAILFFKKALTFRFSSHNFFNLAIAYWYSGDYENVGQSLNAILEVIPMHHDAMQFLASVYLITGKIDKAVEIYTNLTSQSPSTMDLNNLAIAYTLKRDFVSAKNVASKLVKENPNKPTFLLNLADIEWYLGNYNNSKILYQKILELTEFESDMESLKIKAQVYTHLGEHHLAIKALNQANKVAPDSGEIAFISALVYAQLNEKVSAVAKVESALSSGVGEVWFNLPWFDPLCNNNNYLKLFTQKRTNCF